MLMKGSAEPVANTFSLARLNLRKIFVCKITARACVRACLHLGTALRKFLIQEYEFLTLRYSLLKRVRSVSVSADVIIRAVTDHTIARNVS